MANEWGFLEPWRAVLRDHLVPANTSTNEASLGVSLMFSRSSRVVHQTLCLRPPGNETSRRDPASRQQIREAMEIFTLLSLVNNEAFVDLVVSLTETHPTETSDHFICFPSWNLQIVGKISATAAQTEVTWGALLGFPDDPRECSPNFRGAARRLEAMRVDASSSGHGDGKAEIHWACGRHGLYVEGHQSLVRSTSFQGHIRSLLGTIVPHIVRVCVTRGYTVPLIRGIPGSDDTCVVVAWIKNWVQSSISELTTALARTSSLGLSLPSGTMNSRQEAMNAGFMLAMLVCGRSVWKRTTPIGLEYQRLRLTCLSVCDRLFVAICSAVAEASADAKLFSMWLGLDGSGRWSWLVYALCCGTSDAIAPCCEVNGETRRSGVWRSRQKTK